MKKYRTFKSIVHATPTLEEAMERFRRTGQFVLSTDNPSAYEYEDTRPESLDLSNVPGYKVDPFEAAAVGDNSQVGSTPKYSPSDGPASVAEPGSDPGAGPGADPGAGPGVEPGSAAD